MVIAWDGGLFDRFSLRAMDVSAKPPMFLFSLSQQLYGSDGSDGFDIV